MKAPRAIPRGVGAAAGIVVFQAGADAGGQTNVEVWLRIGTLKNVDESLVRRHRETEGNADAER
jgi:hypothetical protein